MRVLLDTHAFLWFGLDDPKLSRAARALIADADNDVMISPASYWEIAIKISNRKYALATSYDQFWRDGIDVNRIEVLPIELRHTSRLISLPYHHRDPFDRLLVAQSLADDIPSVSGDATLDRYGVRRLW